MTLEVNRMINAVNIGKRIKSLRKQKHVSQERMAEDLGMYQADISNLERAMSGSGIADVFKLESIADYFGISLVELLTGKNQNTDENISMENELEDNELKNYTIEEAKYGYKDYVYGSELKLKEPDGSVLYVSFSELDDKPCFYKTNQSIYDDLFIDRDNSRHERKLNQYCFLSGEDYIDIFEKIKPDWIDICRYLTFIATEDEEDAEELVCKTKGKMFSEIEVPVPDREPEDLFCVNYSDLSVVYRYRLMVEASIDNPSVYSDMDDTAKREKAVLKKLKEACASEEAYKVWKKDLIEAKAKEVEEKQHIVVCKYMFAGMGSYEEIIPFEMIDSFKCWIDHNGSAFFGGYRDATRKEIRTYVSQHIADELLGIESSLL